MNAMTQHHPAMDAALSPYIALALNKPESAPATIFGMGIRLRELDQEHVRLEEEKVDRTDKQAHDAFMQRVGKLERARSSLERAVLASEPRTPFDAIAIQTVALGELYCLIGNDPIGKTPDDIILRAHDALLRSLVHMAAACRVDLMSIGADYYLGKLEPAQPECPSPDAELIRACVEHIVNQDTYNASPSSLPSNQDPLWQAYERTRDFIGDTKPRTLAGMQAKARAAKAEAQNLDGTEGVAGTPAEFWAMDLINDLVGLELVPQQIQVEGAVQ